MSEHKTQEAPEAEAKGMEGPHEWHVKIDDDRKLVIFADHMLKVERALTGAKSLIFVDGNEKSLASLQLTGDAAKGDCPEWHIQMRFEVTVETEAEEEQPSAPKAEAAE